MSPPAAPACPACACRGLDVGRKSSIDKLAGGVRAHIEKRLRENRLTLDELIEDLRAQFPAEVTPSRSAIGRYKIQYDQLSSRVREQDNLARLLVSELGENPDERAGDLMVQSVTTLLTHATLNANSGSDDDVPVETISKLARAARDVIQARKVSRDERRQIAKDAREKLIAEQREKLDALGKTGAVPMDMLNTIIQAAYGL